MHPCTGLRLCTGCTAHTGSRGIALPFHDHDTRRGWGVSVTSLRSLPPGKTRYPLYRRLDGPQGRSGQVRKISSPPGLDPRTVQPVASRYTDWATRPIIVRWELSNGFVKTWRELVVAYFELVWCNRRVGTEKNRGRRGIGLACVREESRTLDPLCTNKASHSGYHFPSTRSSSCGWEEVVRWTANNADLISRANFPHRRHLRRAHLRNLRHFTANRLRRLPAESVWHDHKCFRFVRRGTNSVYGR